MYEDLTAVSRQAVTELLQSAGLHPGDLFVVGCSSSEVLGQRIGSASSLEAAQAVFEGIHPVLKERGIYLATQCCEHLNRAVILERAAATLHRLEQVNVIPQPKAGGSFATVAHRRLEDPVAVEEVRAMAGMDIGGTLIGMQLRRVAVPVRLSVKRIGEAPLFCARTRPKFVGGERACYDERLK